MNKPRVASTTEATAADWETMPAACPICAAPDGRTLWTRHGFSWLRCLRDGMVWVSPQLTEASVDEIYRRVDARKAATLGGRKGERGTGREAAITGEPALTPSPSPKTAGGGERRDGHSFPPDVGPGNTSATLPLARDQRERGPGGEGLNPRYRAILDSLAAGLGGPGRLLEPGAFDGDFLRVARQLGWEAEGTEINAAALARARARGLTMHGGRLAALDLAPASYDAIVLRDILEHLPDPLAELRLLRRLLRPGGLLYVWVPNLGSLTGRLLGPRWGAVVFPWHFSYVDGRSLPALLAAAGFRVERLASANLLWRLSDPWEILHGRGAPPGPLARRLNRWAGRLLAPIFRRLDARGHHLGAQLEAWARPDDGWEEGLVDSARISAVPADARGGGAAAVATP